MPGPRRDMDIQKVMHQAAKAEVARARAGAVAGMAAAALIAAKFELDQEAKGQLVELLRSRIHRGMSERQVRLVILVALSLLVMTAHAAGKRFGKRATRELLGVGNKRPKPRK